jgi:hypothetical protein
MMEVAVKLAVLETDLWTGVMLILGAANRIEAATCHVTHTSVVSIRHIKSYLRTLANYMSSHKRFEVVRFPEVTACADGFEVTFDYIT